MAASTTRHRKSISVLAASSAENSTSSQYDNARSTPLTALAMISSCVIRNLNSRWIALVARKTWMRERSAFCNASHARSISPSLHRANPQMIGPRMVVAISRTASKSPGEAIGKPASITSTPREARAWATSSFSPKFILAPGDCSPSRSVVSKIRMLRRLDEGVSA